MRSSDSLAIAVPSLSGFTIVSTLRQQLISGAALMMGLVYGGYVRRAYAQNCTGTGGTYTCSGTGNANITLSPSGALSVTTSAPFSATPSTGTALSLTGTGGVTFTDNNRSTIGSSSGYGIQAINNTTGNLTITTNGTVTGGASPAISATNLGNGTTTITSSGTVTVTGNSRYGISIANSNTTTGGAMAVSVNNLTASGSYFGVHAVNASFNVGSSFSSLSISASGTVTAGSSGIYAYNKQAGTSVAVSLMPGSKVTADKFGINATNLGSGDLSITSSGVVTNTGGNSPRYSGIYAANNSSSAASSTQVTVTATSTVTGTGAAVALYSTQGRSATLNNAGTIANVSGLPTDVAIRTGGTLPGAVTINNTGTITGTVQLAPGVNNTFNNNGVWNTAGGTNDFGSETPNTTVLNNAGTINAGGAAVTTNFNNLTTVVSQLGGVLSLRGSAVGNQAVFGANWVSNGGSVLLNTVLGGTGSKTDQLVINGNAILGSAPSKIFINNQGGTGAAGAQIEVVKVSGSSQSGAFALGGPAIAGAYSYQLEQIGSNWYLVTAGYSPTVSVASAGASILGILESNGLETLRERTGSRMWLLGGPTAATPGTAAIPASASSCGALLLQTPFACGADSPAGVRQPPLAAPVTQRTSGATGGLWAMVKAGADYYAPTQSTAQNNFSLNQMRAKVGLDLVAFDDSTWGQFVVGPTAYYVQAQATVRSASDTGSMQTSGYGFGATATWYAPSGFYADLQGQVSFYNSTYASSTLGSLANGNRGSGWSTALEVGQPVTLGQTSGWKGFSLTPLGQLVYSQAFFDNFVDPYGTSVRLNNANSLILRAGLVPEWKTSWQQADGLERASLYGIFNVTRQLLGPTSVDVSGLTAINQIDPWYGEVGLGGEMSWLGGVMSLHGQITGHTGLSTFGQSTGYAATAGLTIRF